ncbi:hypothetical protein [Anaerospora hongkongensis]|uniref:hypothetical protein n=1 Tax=Anaerospora hongkongensis TaxID=244830 RepID=UPI002896CAD9|nr:hypothetical protein [Anaerospora hongkongensis]
MATQINATFLKISRRAELLDRSYLVSSFVDAGPIFTLLSNIDHQILFGRRGTGKTHALAYLDEYMKSKGSVTASIDMRTLGSSGGIYSDPTIPIGERATRLVMDTLGAIHDQILNYALDNYQNIDLSKVGPALDKLASAITEVIISGTVNQEDVVKDEVKSEDKTTVGFKLAKSPSCDLQINGATEQKNSLERKVVRSGEERHRIHFGTVRAAFEEIVKAVSPRRIWVFFDEWSEVPFDLQPFLADLLRRTLFNIQGITVKIAAIEQRCFFRKALDNGSYIGVEVGADIATSLNLDEYMVFDNDAEKAKAFFKELIFKHVKSIEGDSALTFLSTSEGIISLAFTQKTVFDEFVRAAEGVPRDAINILSIAAQKADNDLISINNIRVAAKTWYNRAKETAVSARPEAHLLLRKIVDEVIAHRRAKAFLVRNDLRHPLIDFLFDARVLHVIKHSISAHDQPGVRFNVYAIDYGCYVDLVNTSRAPQGLFQADTDLGEEIIDVPANDYRSIRRAILNINDIEKIAVPTIA